MGALRARCRCRNFVTTEYFQPRRSRWPPGEPIKGKSFSRLHLPLSSRFCLLALRFSRKRGSCLANGRARDNCGRAQLSSAASQRFSPFARASFFNSRRSKHVKIRVQRMKCHLFRQQLRTPRWRFETKIQHLYFNILIYTDEGFWFYIDEGAFFCTHQSLLKSRSYCFALLCL